MCDVCHGWKSSDKLDVNSNGVKTGFIFHFGVFSVIDSYITDMGVLISALCMYNSDPYKVFI